MNQRANDWIVGGDTGASSKALWAVMMDAKRTGHVSYPSDSADLGRCVRLLDKIPEWRDRLGEIAERSNYWKALVDRWPELEATLREECGPDCKPGSAPRTYALMKSILDPLERADRSIVSLGNGVSLRFGR